jgi:hypothetical protein
MNGSGTTSPVKGALLAKFREAMTVRMIDALASMVNAQLEAVFQDAPQRGHDGVRT